MISGEFFKKIVVVLIVSIPLAIWKMVDIAVWIYNNVQVNIK